MNSYCVLGSIDTQEYEIPDNPTGETDSMDENIYEDPELVINGTFY